MSKWELNHQSEAVQLVDVTDELVALFHPSEKVLGWVRSCRNRAPLPIEEITDDLDSPARGKAEGELMEQRKMERAKGFEPSTFTLAT